MAKLFEVDIRYTDGTDDLVLLTGKDYEEAEAEAEGWIDYRKKVLDITAVREVQQGARRVNRH